MNTTNLSALLIFLGCITSNAYIIGPYTYYYHNFEYWSSSAPDCGTSIQTYDYYYYYDDGSSILYYHVSENDCYNDVYGETSFSVDSYWPVSSSPYKHIHGMKQGTFVSYYEENYDSPPNTNWEYWREDRDWDDEYGNSFSYTKSADTIVAVNVTDNYSKPDHLIPLMINAYNYIWYGDYWGDGGPIPYNQITSSGNWVNCNGSMYIVVSNFSTPRDITAVASGYNNYTFTVQLLPVEKEFKTKSHHPLLSSPVLASTMQNSFNSGSINKLAADSDSCVLDNDPELYFNGIETFKFLDDDSQYFQEFFISASNPETFPAPFTGQEFLDLTSPGNFDEVYNSSHSDIKLVRSIIIDNVTALGACQLGNWNIAYRNSYAEDQTVLLHEWLHSQYVDHRGTQSNPDRYRVMNEKNNTDTMAIMYYGNTGGSENNRNER